MDSYEDKLLLGVSATGALVGFLDVVRGWPSAETWALGLLLLEPDARGHGLGTDVLAQLEARAKESGAARLRLGVERLNDGARRFWLRNGFEPLDPDGNDDLLRFVKSLS